MPVPAISVVDNDVTGVIQRHLLEISQRGAKRTADKTQVA